MTTDTGPANTDTDNDADVPLLDQLAEYLTSPTNTKFDVSPGDTLTIP